MPIWDPKLAFHGDIEDTTEALAYVLGEDRVRFGEAEFDLLVRSYEVARKAHAGQTRASGQPYIIHAIEVARILSSWRLDPATVCAAILHDTIEDTAITAEKLKAQFPTPIPELVDGVTKISKINISSSEDRHIESLRKLILAMSEDLRVTLIKIADRLHNMRTLEHLSKNQQQRISRATLDIYAPLAHRLGMMRVRSELEDLCMFYLWPDEYRNIANLVAKKKEQRDAIVHNSIRLLHRRLREAGMGAVEIEGRPKHFYGIYQKMRTQGLEFDAIYDLVALRVICASIGECYEILGQIHHIWPPMPARFKDYIAMPKENLYQSLHTTVVGYRGQVTEIQIRTQEMHRIAEYGVAAHWKYKEGKRQKTSLDPKLLWLRRVTEWLTDLHDPKEFMSALRHEAFSDTILVFTPKGDVIELPSGATPLDFAYAIHTEVGDHCDGARVNQRVMPLKTALSNGDVVEVITRQSARPSVGWLDIIQTSRARNKIRHYLRNENFDENVQRGHESLQRALKGRNIGAAWSEVEAAIKEHIKSLRVHSVDELLSEIGFGAVKAISVVNKIYPPAKKQLAVERRARQQVTRRKKSAGGVLIEGLAESVVNFAKCCNPLPGDDIIGFITIGRGVSIHKKSCRNLAKSISASPANSHRLLKAHWDQENLPVRTAEIRLVMSDRKGLLGDICNLLTMQDVFIVSSESKSRTGGEAFMRFVVEMKDRDHLRRLLNLLRQQPDVISISPVA